VIVLIKSLIIGCCYWRRRRALIVRRVILQNPNPYVMQNPNLIQGATVITTGPIYTPPPVYPTVYANTYTGGPPAYQQTFQAQAGPKY